MPTTTYKKKSHKSNKRSNSVSKKHKNSKRKHYSNKKNNMRGGSGYNSKINTEFKNPLFLIDKTEHNDYIIKAKEELNELTTEEDTHLYDKRPPELYNNKNKTKPSILYDYANRKDYGDESKSSLFYNNKSPETPEQMRNDFYKNRSDTFRRILQLGEDYVELSTKAEKNNMLIFQLTKGSSSQRFDRSIREQYYRLNGNVAELKHKIERIANIFKKFGLEGFLSGSTIEQLTQSKAIFNKIVSSREDDIQIFKLSQKKAPNDNGNTRV